MPRLGRIAPWCVCLLVLASPVAGSEAPNLTIAAAAGRYIVVLGDERAAASAPRRGVEAIPADARSSGAAVRDRIRRVVDANGIRPSHVYTYALHGFAAMLTAPQRRALEADPDVDRIVPDVRTHVDDRGERPADGGAPSAVKVVVLDRPVVPTGIRRVHAVVSPAADIDGIDSRVDVDVAILDTGIDRSHPDLVVAGGRDCSTGTPGVAPDGYGHGTHVAGTVGALDNGLGVVGVAPGARLWALKVFDDNGEGWLSWFICGIDWVTSKRDRADPARPLIEVANMSLSGTLPGSDDRDCGYPSGDLEHQAICRSVEGGTVYVVAAGNDGRDARLNRPAAYDEVITVSALADFDGRPGATGDQASICPWYSADQDDTFANFSNFGADVDLIAPGKCILSTYPGGRYAWMTGTSMASPTVAGAAALYRVLYPAALPGQVRRGLQYRGSFDWRTGTDPDDEPDPLLDISSFGSRPLFRFSPPLDGRSVITAASSMVVRWAPWESGLWTTASRSLQRLRGRVVTPGTCARVTFVNDGAPSFTSSSVISGGLKPGHCYRWRLRLTDTAGNVVKTISARVLVDSTTRR